ncbi:hypothetical protein J6T21_01245 [Candidatus Saccharibacteria bacterium]|nr:hypothetical protein [Candidatus Saccharibacteria bacterium]
MNKIRKSKIKTLVFSIIFAFVNLFTLATPVQNAYAEPVSDAHSYTATLEELSSEVDEVDRKDLCREGFDNVSWLFCDKIGTGANAVDYLYEKIETTLRINPISGESGNIVARIWDICRGITNIVFVILMMLVVLSQITGMGISNYGIKRALPKLIIAAIAVNLSFVICQYAVDLSNTIGISIHDLFTGIEGGVINDPSKVNFTELTAGLGKYYDALSNGTAITLGVGTLVFETGAIFMLLPAVLAAIVAVVSGFLTIALRQVVVILCVMIAPLAMVAMIFPNTIGLFRKWRHTFISMLVFFPMFSLLFGASHLAAFAIGRAAGTDGFLALVSTIVQYAPLILCWKLMRMSGTVLGGVHSTVSGVLSGLFVNPARRYAASLAMHRRAHTLAQVHPYTPSAKLMQYLEDRRISRDMDIAEYSQHAKQRAAAFNSNKKYRFNNKGEITRVTKDGFESYAMQAKSMQYAHDVLRDKTAMEQGLGAIETLDQEKMSDKERAQLMALDNANVRAADKLFTMQQHANDVAFKNAIGRDARFNAAIDARVDSLHTDEFGHKNHNVISKARYDEMRSIMGSNEGVYIAAAAASSVSESVKALRQGQFQKFFDSTVPTQDVVNRLKDLTTSKDAAANIDAIVAGMRTLNKRGDHTLIKNALDDLFEDGKILLGTSASQTLANFLISEVKGADPTLRRFGKYLNLETARYFNTDKNAEGKNRLRQSVDFDEYVNNGYDMKDSFGNLMHDDNGNIIHDTPKSDYTRLMMGTSFKDIEREAFDNIINSINKASKGDKKKAQKLQENIFNAILPSVLSDQFSWASGSEQVNAWARFITGKKIVGYDNNDLSKPRYEDDEKLKAMFAPDFFSKRVDTFLSGEVANQANKQKTDVIIPVAEVYKQRAEEEFLKKEHSQLYKEWQAEEQQMLANGYEFRELRENNGKKETEEDFAKSRFAHYMYRNTLKPFVRTALAKQFMKGYAGDTKENSVETLGFNDYKDSGLMRALAPGQTNKSKKSTATNSNNTTNGSQNSTAQPTSASAEGATNNSESNNSTVNGAKLLGVLYNTLKNMSEEPEEFDRLVQEQMSLLEEEPEDDDDDDDFDGGAAGGVSHTNFVNDAVNTFKCSSGSKRERVSSVREFLENNPDASQEDIDNVRELEEGLSAMPYISDAEIEDYLKKNL